jgi:type 1 glutamine amidotransferase
MRAILKAFAATAVVWLAAAPVYAQSKKVVFLAGPKDHGFPGRHEYEKDLRVLAHCLENSPNLQGITTKVYVGKAPQDINELSDAAVIVIESSSDRDAREHTPLFPQDPATNHNRYDPETMTYLREFDNLMKKGVGLVVFHYATWAENNRARQLWLDSLGGLWVQAASRNPDDEWAITLKNEDHPILRGVHPWTYRDEIFCRFFLLDVPGRTDLLLATPKRWKIGPQIAAWAYQREDGHRGFVMGGVDYHNNMKIDDYRRFLLNGIVWAGHIEVPPEGVASSVTDELLK